MPLTISTEAVAEKNKMASNAPWLLLMEVVYTGEPAIRLAWNTEAVTWDGAVWQPAQFRLGDQEESQDGTVPTVNLSIVDIERNLIPLIDEYGGGVGAEVTVRMVHSAHLANNVPELEAEYEVISVQVGHDSSVQFTLGAENLSDRRSPPDMYLKLHCRYDEFKGDHCGYTGGAAECDRTFARCRELDNQTRFGGFPAIGRLGIWT